MKVESVEKFLGAYKRDDYHLFLINGDEYDLKEVIETIKGEFEKDKIEILFKDDAEEILPNLSMKTLFGAKLIIVYEVDTLPQTVYKKILKFLEEPNKIKPNTVILTYFRKQKMPSIKHSLAGYFKLIYDSQIPSWTSEFVKKNHHTIDEEAIRLLHFSCGTNRAKIKEQIERIISEKEKTDTFITVKDVKNIGFHREDTIFKITNSLIEGKYKIALQYLLELHNKESLFYLINRDIRYLLIIKANLELGEDIKRLESKDRLALHSYFLYKTYKPAAQRMHYKDLTKQYENIMNMEYRIKHGWDEFSANFNFICQLQQEANNG